LEPPRILGMGIGNSAILFLSGIVGLNSISTLSQGGTTVKYNLT